MKKLLITLALLSLIKYGNNHTIASEDSQITNITIPIPVHINLNITIPRNNPGNLRSIRTGKFRKFKTLTDGYNALLDDINIKQTGNSKVLKPNATIYEFVHVYAPTFENNTELYINVLCDRLNVTQHTLISSIPTERLAKEVIYLENVELYKLMYGGI